MTVLDDQDLTALALTSRLVDSTVKPLSSREFWALRRDVEPSALHGMTAADIASEFLIPSDTAERIARLCDRSAALALAVEKLDHSGIGPPPASEICTPNDCAPDFSMPPPSCSMVSVTCRP